MTDEHGGFEGVRENVDGHPMVNLVSYATPYWVRLLVGILAAFLTRFARLVPPIVVAAAIDRVVLNSGEPGLLSAAGLLPTTAIAGEAAKLAFLRRLVVIAALAYLLRSVTRFVSRYLLQSSAQKIQRDLRNDTYDHLQHLSMDFFTGHQTGGMMSILNSDINRLESFLNTEFRQLIRVVATVGGIAAVLYWHSPTLALIALAPVPIIGIASGYFLSWIEPRYRSIRRTVSRLNTRLENNLSGAPVIKAFDRYEFENERVTAQSQTYHDEKVAALRIRRAFFAGLRLLTGVVFVAILYVAGRDFVTSPDGAAALQTGTFALFFLYLRRLYSPMRRVGKSANKYQLAKSSAERVFGLLGREPTITDPADPYAPDDVDGEVSFDDVTFGYEADRPVLRNVSLDVPAGATVGLAGPTGAGKSTLLKLVPRFHDVDSGAVRVDGVDVREYGLQALRGEVAVVEQQPYLFSGTVAENVAYGDREVLDGERGGSEEARERVREAARAAQADEFIAALPEGYDTQIGERGVKLSGGQRQRVAIARALLNDPEIIIFDEATSDVDTETEERIQASIERLVEDRTAFVIAHRLSTIQDADRIIVMDDGEIVERGSHDDLLASEGDYADLWRAQADEGPLEADD
ncbi:ABC transporter ATP-binding protein [Haloarcula nitratireducens]|uniref:ABC transporter ATP-binding protein/permease n=1 Tax=Haloarcula nitratireducens TaxID=2487749 RepID=A0AAW4P6X2_9EURY|nr:ABC transporter ATP-binding protein [Halomicroarcula nitratireducens]MBX0293455.1 ABC transporter ATP-binding protein/permease [Halomicroarcula nitratireducens]